MYQGEHIGIKLVIDVQYDSSVGWTNAGGSLVSMSDAVDQGF
jgi:hypothetical protein